MANKKNPTKEEYLKLIGEIRKYDQAYFDLAQPLIGDWEYDQLVKRVEAIESRHSSWTDPSSPTHRISERPSSGFIQKEHEIPMLSLANTYSLEELEDFTVRLQKLTGLKENFLCVELKMDGVAVSARYEKGRFVQALTRGDGKKGDLITENLKTIRSLPLKLDGLRIPELIELRGEVFLSHRAFHTANQKKEEAGASVWANPRNAAAGSLKLLDSKEVYARRLSVIFYGIAQESSGKVKSQFAAHEILKQWGLPCFPSRFRNRAKTIDEVLSFAKRVEKERRSLGFDIDGIVVKLDDLNLQKKLGATGKSPRWAVAYKFAPEQATTKILSISVQVGRTGVLTPVAHLEPVFLAGSKISRATLHNQQEIERKDIRVGDTVVIEKGGDVIPKVVQVKSEKRPKSSKRWRMPKTCPHCGSQLVEREKEVAVRCPNRKCGDQILRRIAHFVNKNAFDIEGMGAKVVQQLVEKGLVKEPSDIFALTREEIALLDGFKEKSVDNLVSSINKARTTTLSRLIFSLGISFVGATTADLLAEKAGNIPTLMEMDKEELMEIEGVGEKLAEAITRYCSSPENQREIKRLLDLGVQTKKISTYRNHPFSGKIFVITGTLDSFDRSAAEALIKERGGKVGSSVSHKTDYLVLGQSPGSKYDKALKLGIKILPERKFTSLMLKASKRDCDGKTPH